MEQQFVTKLLGVTISPRLWWQIVETALSPLFVKEATQLIARSLALALGRSINADIARCAGILANPACDEVTEILSAYK